MESVPWSVEDQKLVAAVLEHRLGVHGIDTSLVGGDVVTLADREVLLSPGSSHPYLYWITEGILRVRIEQQDGTTKVLEFYAAGQAMCLPSTLESRWLGPSEHHEPHVRRVLDRYRRQASPYHVQALSPVTAIRMPFPDLERAAVRNRQWARAALHHLLVYSAVMEKRVFDSLRLDAEERYDQFLRERGDLVNQVPAKDVASFVGITPETLSRIRSRTA